MCREKIGEVLQAVLEAEVDEFLGRIRAERDRKRSGHRDGHEDARTVTYGSHPVQVRAATRSRERRALRFESATAVSPSLRGRRQDAARALDPRIVDARLRAVTARIAWSSDPALTVDDFSCEQAVQRRVQNLVQAPDRKRVRVSLGRWGLSGRRPQ